MACSLRWFQMGGPVVPKRTTVVPHKTAPILPYHAGMAQHTEPTASVMPDQAAVFPPYTLRSLVAVAAEHGVAQERLCRGLGVTEADLNAPHTLISFRQGAAIIRRALAACTEPALGLVVGARQTLVSWGAIGFGMMACSTLGEAAQYAVQRQAQAGALPNFSFDGDHSSVFLVAHMRFEDAEVERFLVEEGFASQLRLARQLVGEALCPLAVELRYPEPAHHAAYREFFRCSVRFNARENRMRISAEALATPIVGSDPSARSEIHALIEQLLQRRHARQDLTETLMRRVRENLIDLPKLQQLAADLNVSERSLRRQLSGMGTSYRALVDETRKAAALEALSQAKGLSELALDLGFADLRAFKRAFRRWTGVTPHGYTLNGTMDSTTP